MNSEVHENLETKTEDIEITIENIEFGMTEYSRVPEFEKYISKKSFIW